MALCSYLMLTTCTRSINRMPYRWDHEVDHVHTSKQLFPCETATSKDYCCSCFGPHPSSTAIAINMTITVTIRQSQTNCTKEENMPKSSRLNQVCVKTLLSLERRECRCWKLDLDYLKPYSKKKQVSKAIQTSKHVKLTIQKCF